MKSLKLIAVVGMVASVSGCATSSKVQEMIDASYREQTGRADSHEKSIDVLRTSAMTSLEKSKENSEKLIQIQAQLEVLKAQVKLNKENAEASKVMSAGNTVKTAELEDLLKANTEIDETTRERLKEIDRLYERVMISHYQMIAESANNAIENLKVDGWIGSTNAPVKIDEPIEIVAPTTAPATDSVPKQ